MNTIIVGLGSGGSKIVNNFAKMLDIEKEHIAKGDLIRTVCIDTDRNMIEELETKKFVDRKILITKGRIIEDIFKHATKLNIKIENDEKTFYKLNNESIYFDNRIDIGNEGGVGQRRAASNVLLFEMNRNFNVVYNYFNDIFGEIKGREVAAGTRYMVWLIGGAGGGSGSGLMPGVARIIKSIFEDSCDINTLLLLPVGQGTNNFADITNSYLLIRELDFLNKGDQPIKRKIWNRDIIYRDPNLFRTMNFISMHHFGSHEEGEEFIKENIIPNFLKMFQYGSYNAINAQQQLTFQPLIEMQNFTYYLGNSGGKYGTINYFEVYTDTKSLIDYCRTRDRVERLDQIKLRLEDYKILFNKLINGSNKFNNLKDNMFKNREKKIDNKVIWNKLIKNIKNDSDKNEETYDNMDIGLKNLESAYNQLKSWGGLVDNEDSNYVKMIHEEVRNKIKESYIGVLTLLQSGVITEIEFKNSKEFEKYLREIESKIDKKLATYLIDHEEYVDISNAVNNIIENSKYGTVMTIPKFERQRIENNKDIFDKIYNIYKESANNLDFSLSQMIVKLNENAHNFAEERIRSFFSLGSEYSIFNYPINELDHPISWAICLSHDDDILIDEWENYATKGYLMAPRDKRLHILNHELKDAMWNKSRWCMLSWINGYLLENSADFAKLEEEFNKLDQNKYNQIIYPEAFGNIITIKNKQNSEDTKTQEREKDIKSEDTKTQEREKDIKSEDTKTQEKEKDIKSEDTKTQEKEKDTNSEDTKTQEKEKDTNSEETKTQEKEKDTNSEETKTRKIDDKKLNDIFSKIK